MRRLIAVLIAKSDTKGAYTAHIKSIGKSKSVGLSIHKVMSPPPNWTTEPVDESNVADWQSTTLTAFFDPAEGASRPFLDLFYPKGLTPAINEWQLNYHKSNIKKTGTYFYFIVRDQSLPGKPCIGAARWEVVGPKTKAEYDAAEVEAVKERDEDRRIPDINHDNFEVFRVAQAEGKWRFLQGRPFLYLRTLSVHPDHQKRGVGTELMKWGMRKADELEIDSYLESSVAGKKLYERCGYEAKGYLDFDTTKFEGFTDSYPQLAMIRPPGTGSIEY